jgi:hypothetical protein
MGYMVANYLDDLGGAETVNKACDAYDALGGLLATCELEESNKGLTNNLPGRTQLDTKWSFPNNDCKSRKEAFSYVTKLLLTMKSLL